MSKKLLALVLSLSAFLFCSAQERRALIIAIDKYTPPPGTQIPGTARSVFNDLDGCINDARSIHSIITSRFQFKTEKVDTLYNDAATRVGIEKEMLALLDKSNPNDIAFIYYAGHGSRVPNSLSEEVDKIDESMVPSDTWKPGVEDLRDKQLAGIYNKFIDKGVKLTVIMDCCHSGSLSRGPNDPGRFRFIADANYDAKDATKPIVPETRPEGTFLIISAAQDNEYAQEQRDENNTPHGAFTIAFIQALQQQSVNASVLNLFTSIRAILKSNGKKQEPVLGGSTLRQQQTLFGIEKGTIPDKSLVAVSGIDRNRVTLQGGFALGLYKENELVKFNGKDTLVKLVIDSVISVNKSTAIVIKGNIKDLKPGELVEVTNWVSSRAPLLKVYIPTGNMTYEEVVKLAAVNNELKASKKVKWINDLEKADPYTTVFYDGSKYRINVDGKNQNPPATITSASILQLSKEDSTLYFELPPSKDLATAVKEKISQNKSMVIVNNLSDANYVLFGTIDDDGKPSYGLRRAQTSSRDSLESMPIQTKVFPLENSMDLSNKTIADSVYEYAMRLSKIRGWLQLTPPKEGSNSFPYRLELINKESNTAITNHEYKIGDKIAFHLVADAAVVGTNTPKRYIYLFLIDKNGNMILGYPSAEDGNVGNQFPKLDSKRELVKDVFLFEGEVSEPVGTDNYFLLASDEQIPNYDAVFNQEGVRGTPRGVNPLGNLLNLGNEGGTRGFTKSVANWNLIKLPVKSKR
ncbi:MAG: caspase family protein [Chitinophagaceae bacterium]|nr:caspase family protein [Chitinophagaceae bacterium]HQW44924.1 caspase family protein [Chitinophagaceae bacterium]